MLDEEAAQVVRKIFALCMNGNGPTQIARILEQDNIPTPAEYWQSRGIKTPAAVPARPHGWQGVTVADILERMEYLGHTVNFRTSRKSFKNKKTMKRDPSEWKVFEHTHPAIVEEAVWERVQEIRKNKRRPLRSGKVSLFSGLLECADCGRKLYYCTSSSFSKNQDHFVCSSYRGKGLCSAHYIREIVLFNLVLEHLRQMMRYVKQYEDLFVRSIKQQSTEEQARAIVIKRKTLEQHTRRIQELDVLFRRVYEDNISNRLTDERFLQLSTAYETEQATLKQEAETLEAELTEEKQSIVNIERFLSLVKSYTEIDSLSPTILHEFIEKIVIHAPDKSSGKRKQKVEIFYNAVGIIDVPSEDDMVEYLMERKRQNLSKRAM